VEVVNEEFAGAGVLISWGKDRRVMPVVDGVEEVSLFP
jgi:hypothetical protein